MQRALTLDRLRTEVLGQPAPSAPSIPDALDRAARARAGDSNDTEIDALWEAVKLMAEALGLMVPEYDPFDTDD